MNRHKTKQIYCVLGVLALMVTPQFVYAQNNLSSSDADPHAHHKHMLKNTETAVSTHSYILPDVALVDSRGNQTSLHKETSVNAPVMLNFIFTTCTTICPVLTATFSQIERELGDEIEKVRMISITIDPEYDTPEKLNEYAARFHAGDQWQFLTGNHDDIISVQRAFSAFHGSKMNHEPITFLRSETGANWTRIDGMASASDIIMQYRALSD